MDAEDTTYGKLRKTWEQVTEAMLQAMPANNYAELINALRIADYSFRSAVAKRLEPALNNERNHRHSYDYRDKKQLTAWVNEEAAQFGLGLRCPDTLLPSMVVAVKHAQDHGGGGKFCFQHHSERSQSGFKTTSTFDELPPLQLTPINLEAPSWDIWTHSEIQRRNRRGSRRDEIT